MKGKEVLLDIDFRLKKAEPLMEAGQIIAYSQLAVKEKSCCGHCTSKQASTPAGKNVKAKLIDRKGEADLAVVTPDLTLKISRATGLISAFTCQGKSLLGEGGTLKPNFWRAPTDNDMGAGLQKKFKLWKQPELTLKNLTATKDKKANTFSICATYTLPQLKADLSVTYLVMANTGMVKVTETLQMAEGEKADDLFRFGMLMQLPYDMSESEYYGRGPIENYSDRKECMRIGIYRDRPTINISPTSVHRKAEPRAICAGGSRPTAMASD